MDSDSKALALDNKRPVALNLRPTRKASYKILNEFEKYRINLVTIKVDSCYLVSIELTMHLSCDKSSRLLSQFAFCPSQTILIE